MGFYALGTAFSITRIALIGKFSLHDLNQFLDNSSKIVFSVKNDIPIGPAHAPEIEISIKYWMSFPGFTNHG